jgi:hypothetical protein
MKPNLNPSPNLNFDIELEEIRQHIPVTNQDACFRELEQFQFKAL